MYILYYIKLYFDILYCFLIYYKCIYIIYIFAHICIHIKISIYIYVYIDIRVYIYIYIYSIYLFTYDYIYIHIYIYVYICSILILGKSWMSSFSIIISPHPVDLEMAAVSCSKHVCFSQDVFAKASEMPMHPVFWLTRPMVVQLWLDILCSW